MSLKLLATSDLHLGKRSSAIRDHSEKPATKYTWMQLIEWAIHNQVDAMLLAGDIVDHDNHYFESIGPLEYGFERLKKANINVYMVAGNHDYDVLPTIIRKNKYTNVNLLGVNGEWEAAWLKKGGQQIQLVGWSFPTRHFKMDPLLTFNPALMDSNYMTIGLLHGDMNNVKSDYGRIEYNNLLNKQVNVWVLGHIHKPHAWGSSNPFIFYPGSPHSLSPKETGPHGPVLLTIEASGEIQTRRIHLSPVRYDSAQIDITGYEDQDDLRTYIYSTISALAKEILVELDRVAFMVYDVYLIGHHSKIKHLEAWLSSISNDTGWPIEGGTLISVRKIIYTVKPLVQHIADLAKQSTPAGIVAQTILAIENNHTTPFLKKLQEKWHQMLDRTNTATPYRPLRAAALLHECTKETSDQFILQQCNLLLGELLSQQNNQ